MLVQKARRSLKEITAEGDRPPKEMGRKEGNRAGRARMLKACPEGRARNKKTQSKSHTNA